jgi:hypothetical protein
VPSSSFGLLASPSTFAELLAQPAGSATRTATFGYDPSTSTGSSGSASMGSSGSSSSTYRVHGHSLQRSLPAGWYVVDGPVGVRPTYSSVQVASSTVMPAPLPPSSDELVLSTSAPSSETAWGL